MEDYVAVLGERWEQDNYVGTRFDRLENVLRESPRINTSSPKDIPRGRYYIYQVCFLDSSGQRPQKIVFYQVERQNTRTNKGRRGGELP